jgi:hypothetical protein
MSDLACNTLAEHIAERVDGGLVDIKFYLHDAGAVSGAEICAEAQTLFAAIKAGAVEDFEFGDRHPRS